MRAVEAAIGEAVSLHGDPGRMVGWTVRAAFDEILGHYYGAYIPVQGNLAVGVFADAPNNTTPSTPATGNGRGVSTPDSEGAM